MAELNEIEDFDEDSVSNSSSGRLSERYFPDNSQIDESSHRWAHNYQKLYDANVACEPDGSPGKVLSMRTKTSNLKQVGSGAN